MDGMMTRTRESQRFSTWLAPSQNSREGLGLVPQACNPGTQEVKLGDSKFQTSHSYTVRLSQKSKREWDSSAGKGTFLQASQPE